MRQRRSRNLIIASAILLAIVLGTPVPQRSIGMQVFHDFGHGPVFGVIAILALLWLRDRALVASRASEYALAFVISSVLGIAIEALQIPLGRDASWLDVRSDLLGAGGFLGLFAIVDRRITNRAVRVLGAAIGCAALAVHSMPLVRVTLKYVERNASFPVVFDAREHYEDTFLDYFEATGEHLDLPSIYARSAGEKALLLHLEHRWAPRLSFVEPLPDWREFRALALDLVNPADAPLALKIGVFDRDYDEAQQEGFVRVVTLPPQQRTTVRIPLEAIEHESTGRPVDLARVHFIRLFDEYASAARDVYVVRVWLE